jgi:hypothetical protein
VSISSSFKMCSTKSVDVMSPLMNWPDTTVSNAHITSVTAAHLEVGQVRDRVKVVCAGAVVEFVQHHHLRAKNNKRAALCTRNVAPTDHVCPARTLYAELCCSKRAVTCDPMKPAPPVNRMLCGVYIVEQRATALAGRTKAAGQVD